MITALVAGFVIGGVSSMPVAGAVSVFVCRRGLAGHLRQGLALAVGAALAEGAWCLLVLTGAGRVVSRWPVVATVARFAGGLLLLGLGFVFLIRHVQTPALAEGDEPPLPRLRDDFRLGATLAGANLAIPVNWLALSALAISWGLHPQIQPEIFAAGVFLGIVTWYVILLALLAHLGRLIPATAIDRLQHLLGVVLIAGGVVTLARFWF
jgi:threonine/homoserine/homoserine lactone efflux protein